MRKRDDRFLEGTAQLGPHERVEPPTQSVVGDAHGGPQATQTRRRGVEELSHRIETPSQRGAERRQRMQVTAKVAQQRPTLVRQDGRQASGRVERVGDREEVRRFQATAPDRSFDGRADIVGAADADIGTLLEQGEGLIGLVERSGDDDRVRRRLQRLGKAP